MEKQVSCLQLTNEEGNTLIVKKDFDSEVGGIVLDINGDEFWMDDNGDALIEAIQTIRHKLD